MTRLEAIRARAEALALGSALHGTLTELCREDVPALLAAVDALRWIAEEGGKQGCGYREAEEIAAAALARLEQP